MLTPREQYLLSFRVAIVSGVFSFVVCVLLLVDFAGRVADDPLNAPSYLDLKAKLADKPQDVAIKTQMRETDVRLRYEYFQRRRFTVWGTWFLVGGAAIAIVAATRAATLHTRLPRPPPKNGPEDPEESTSRISRWAVGAVGGSLAVLAAGLHVNAHSVLPQNDTAVAKRSGEAEPRAEPKSEPVQPKPVKPIAAPEQKAPKEPPPATDTPAESPESHPTPESHPSLPKEPPAPAPTPDVSAKPPPPPSSESQLNWARFRGSTGLGISPYANIPTKFDGATGQGVRWKTEIPLPGNSSPIVWGSRVFVTGASEEQRTVFCLAADSGQILWQTPVPGTPASTAEPPKVAESTGFAASTPATDGRRVYAVFANGDIAGIDFEGKVCWSRSLGLPKNSYGHASSLCLFQDLVVVQFDQGTKKEGLSKLLALKAESGETAWEAPRQVPNSWPTPVVIEHEGQAQIITAADPWVIAYSPADGKELWRAQCLQADVGPSPVFADGIVYVANEFPGIAAIRLGGTGDVSATNILWEADVGAPDCASPLATDKFVLVLASYGILTCYKAKEGGEPLWEEEFEDANFTSSPTLAGPYVYLFENEGKVWIVEPTETQCKRVAEANLGEACVTSPAFQEGRIYVRGEQHLFCLGEK